MEIRIANNNDIKWLSENDRHITSECLKMKIANKEIFVAEEKDIIGWIRFSLFWDNIPFMNFLYVITEYQRMGVGQKLVDYWEKEMRKIGYNKFMTSTLSNENAQEFYRKIGYSDIGGFILPGEAMELILLKEEQKI